MPFILQTSAAAAGNRFVKAHDMPANFKVIAMLAVSTRLTWTNVDATATEILVRRSVNGAPFRDLTTLPPTTTLYEDATVENGKTYAYRIAAKSSSGRSRWAVARRVTIPNPPEAIQNLVVGTVKAIGTSNITMTWTKSAGQGMTKVQMATDPDYTENLYETNRNTAAYEKTGLPQNTFYYVRVQPLSSYVTSPWTEAHITTAG